MKSNDLRRKSFLQENNINSNEVIGTKNPIFLIKKYYRNGLLEKKIMKKRKVLNNGAWTKTEHQRFINAGIKHGPNWRKIKREIRTRTLAQIRSHAQKYLIKLCKKYGIEIFCNKDKDTAEESNLNKTIPKKISLHKINTADLIMIQNFNIYAKRVDLNCFRNLIPIFRIEKVGRRPIQYKPSTVSVSYPSECLEKNKSPELFDKLMKNNNNSGDRSINNIDKTVNKLNNDSSEDLNILGCYKIRKNDSLTIERSYINDRNDFNFNLFNYLLDNWIINKIIIEYLSNFNFFVNNEDSVRILYLFQNISNIYERYS